MSDLSDPMDCSLAGSFIHGSFQYSVWNKYYTSRNRFKGLDLIDRVPDELWNEVRDTVQETGIKAIPMEKKCKKAKCCLGRPYK